MPLYSKANSASSEQIDCKPKSETKSDVLTGCKCGELQCCLVSLRACLCNAQPAPEALLLNIIAAEQKEKISCLQVDTDWSLNYAIKQCVLHAKFQD